MTATPSEGVVYWWTLQSDWLLVCAHPSLCAGVENYCPDGVQLVIGDVPDVPFGAHPPGQAEIIVHQHLLSQLICALKVNIAKGHSEITGPIT